MKKFFSIFGAVVAIIFVIGLPIFFGLTPTGKRIWNNWFYGVQVADDQTNYQTRKNVEDTCRAMIASYNNDKLIYLQYKDSENELEIQMSNNARTRANQTASTYNNYILRNRYVWRDNVPSDIYMTLAYIE